MGKIKKFIINKYSLNKMDGQGLREKKVTTIFNAYRTVMQMLKDRGYEVSDVKLNVSYDELKKNIKRRENIEGDGQIRK